MPFLIGRDAIRRTIPYLKRGKLTFRKNVRVMTIYYSEKGDYNQGAKDFVHWNLCQVMYKNPDVQVLFFKNMFPTPFVRCWLDSGDDVLMDAFNKTNVEIMDHLVKVLGQPDLKETEERKDTLENVCKFGTTYERHCMCEVPGQVPCPQVVPLPKHMTGKYKLEHNLYPPKGQYRE